MSARKKTSRRKSPRRPRRVPLTLKLWFAGIFLVGFVLVSLLLLGKLRTHYLAQAPPPAPVAEPLPSPPPKTVTADWSEIQRLLRALGWKGEPAGATEPGAEWQYAVARPLPPRPELATLASRLNALQGLTAELVPGHGLRITMADGRRGMIVFQLPSPLPHGKNHPRLAIIVDDLGRDLGSLRQLLALKLPLTLSILPGEIHARECALAAHAEGREVMIHIPMEPQAYPAVNPGADALFVSATPEELRQRFQKYLTEVPYAVGGNNHMGSRFTEDPGGMAVVLQQMREAGLFFVDSKTTGASVAYELARRAGIPTAQRDIFLDNVQDEVKIGAEIRKLIRVARQRGSAIAICHPHPTTIAALRRAVPELLSSGVEVVPVSQLLTMPTAGQ